MLESLQFLEKNKKKKQNEKTVRSILSQEKETCNTIYSRHIVWMLLKKAAQSCAPYLP